MNKLKAWYANLQPREQRIVGFGAIAVAAMILIGGILLPLQSAVTRAVKGSDSRREDLAWMGANAAEIRSRGAEIPADTGEAPVVLVCSSKRRPSIHWSPGSTPWIAATVSPPSRSASIAPLRPDWSMPASRSVNRDIERARPPRRWPLILAGAIVLIGAAIFVLPASLAARFLPAQVHADDFSGSLLHGAAGKLSVNARDAGALEWQGGPFALLRFRRFGAVL